MIVGASDMQAKAGQSDLSDSPIADTELRQFESSTHIHGLLDATRRVPDRMVPVSPDAAANVATPLGLVLDRGELFAGLLVIGFANGILARVANEIQQREWADVVMNTFGVSAFVWIALVVGIGFLRRGPRSAATPADAAVACATALAFLAPVGPLSWLALTGLGIHILCTSQIGTYQHRAGWIIVAITIPMFWSRMAFSLLSDFILRVDATLVSWLIGTERAGNAIAFSDGSGYLWIAPGCSSLHNVSLAILCWVLVTQLLYRERPVWQAGWAVLACAAVVGINVTRLSLLGLYREHQDIVHGALGATLANWLTFTAIIAIYAVGVRHDLAAQRCTSSSTSAAAQPGPQAARKHELARRRRKQPRQSISEFFKAARLRGSRKVN